MSNANVSQTAAKRQKFGGKIFYRQMNLKKTFYHPVAALLRVGGDKIPKDGTLRGKNNFKLPLLSSAKPNPLVAIENGGLKTFYPPEASA